MPIKMIRQDITKIKCDAIVAPTDSHYSHMGGTDEMIHNAAGEELYRACIEQGALLVGKAVLTPAFNLDCKYVIHTVGPHWRGGENCEEELLRSCYTEALRLATENGCKSVAFPLISSGTFAFPKKKVLKIAMETIGEYLFTHEMLVYVVVFDKESYAISSQLFADVTDYLDENYLGVERCRPRFCEDDIFDMDRQPSLFTSSKNHSRRIMPKSLDDRLKSLDKGFADTLFEYIDQKGLTDVECYKRANIDKKTFSKIKCVKNYRPSKITAVSFAIALRLNAEETARLLNTVGMSLSRSNKFDVIIEYFITTGNYKDIFDVNETLYQFDQATLGV